MLDKQTSMPECSSGYSLIEILVTMAITTIGLVGLAGLQSQANRSAADTGNQSQAVWMAQDLVNRIRANPSEGQTRVDLYTGANIDCNAQPAMICSSYHSGTQRITGQFCSPQQMAAFDVWEVACGVNADVRNGAVTKGSPTDFIANPTLVVTDALNGNISIDISWDVRTSGLDAGGNKVYSAEADYAASRSELVRVFNP